MGKAPAFQFYVKDWLSDPELQCVSASTRGIWIDALCYMWEAHERGKLNGTFDELSKLLRATNGDFTQFLNDVERHKFADVTKCNNELTIINRRMYREQKYRENTRLRVSKFRSNVKSNVNVTPPSSSSSPSPINNNKTYMRLFEKFWALYPLRNGKKVTKKETLQFFKDNFKTEEKINLLIKATQNYSESKIVKDGYSKDPIRFLKKDFWMDWIDKSIEKDNEYEIIGGKIGTKD